MQKNVSKEGKRMFPRKAKECFQGRQKNVSKVGKRMFPRKAKELDLDYQGGSDFFPTFFLLEYILLEYILLEYILFGKSLRTTPRKPARGRELCQINNYMGQ